MHLLWQADPEWHRTLSAETCRRRRKIISPHNGPDAAKRKAAELAELAPLELEGAGLTFRTALARVATPCQVRSGSGTACGQVARPEPPHPGWLQAGAESARCRRGTESSNRVGCGSYQGGWRTQSPPERPAQPEPGPTGVARRRSFLIGPAPRSRERTRSRSPCSWASLGDARADNP